MRLWFDEDLSPTLVQVANECGVEATCNRDRSVLGVSDRTLRELVYRDGFIFVTDNASDFRPMYAREQAHPGLLVMPASVGRARQQELARALIEWIAAAAVAVGESPRDFMINKLVQIDSGGDCVASDLPPR